MKFKIKSHGLLCVNECTITDDENIVLATFRDAEVMRNLIELAEQYGTYRFQEGKGTGYIPNETLGNIYLEDIIKLLLAQEEFFANNYRE